jgi:hypothetical protein
MMSRDEARARVKDAADAELVERLEHLDALRANPPRDDDAPPRGPTTTPAPTTTWCSPAAG